MQLDSVSLKQGIGESDDHSMSSTSSATLISLNEYESDDRNDDSGGRSHKHANKKSFLASREIKIIIVSFGMRLIFTSAAWDHFVNKYQSLLHIYSNNIVQRVSEPVSSNQIQSSNLNFVLQGNATWNI